MRTNKHTRKTMGQDWIDFFKLYKGKKYFKDNGYQCCAYRPESGTDRNGHIVVQTAIRRSHGIALSEFNDVTKNFYERSLGLKSTGILNLVYITCASMHGGIYGYDLISMRHKGYCFEDKVNHDDHVTRDRGVNKYYNVPLTYCTKFHEVWDMPKVLCLSSLYSCAQWQYEEMTREDSFGNSMYDDIHTWEDLPDWCFWKYHNVDGTVIEARKEQYEAYIAKCKADSRYIPAIKELQPIYK